MSRAWRAALCCLPLLACRDRGERGAWNFERMLEQRRYDVYERSRSFADGKVLQHPPPGTVPVERIVGPPLFTRGEEGGRHAERIPVPVTPELIRLGEARFRVFCAACHGIGGYGGSIVAMNMRPPRPPSLRSPEARARPPGHIYHMVAHGGERMPSYAAELPVLERWAVVAYVQRLQRAPGAGPAARDDSIRGALLRVRDSLARADSARRADSLARAGAGR